LGEYTRYLYAMPFLNDLRRTVTINLYPDEYESLAEDALTAGYKTPGTYAKALILARGEAPEPILDQRSAERVGKLQGANEWLLEQFEHVQAVLQKAGVPFQLAPGPGGGPAPRSWAAQQRAVDKAVAEALAQERAQVARRLANQARRDAASAVIKPRTQP
jgi:hypothetical protein